MKNETSHNIEWEVISKYLSGEMSEEEKAAFKKVIDSNPEYAQIIAASEKDLGLVEDVMHIRELYNADIAWNKVNDQITNKKSGKKITLNAKRILQFAAMIIVVIGLGLISNKVYNDYLSPYQTFISQAHESNKSIVLADGSTIILNGKAKLVYPRKFNDDTRNVSLEGEAFFDIAKNPNKAFIITAKDAEIKVLGTSFNVIAKDDKVEVLVKSGKVRFSEINNKESVILEKGDFAILKESLLSKSLMNDDNYLSWKTQKMVFRSMELKEVAKVIERTYHVQIQFESNEIEKEQISTTFDQESLSHVLSNICMTFNLTYEKKGQTIILKKGI
ncbi:FecR family protein [Marinifilum flexuosum]|uniref:FecR family protein n=1 Tax=Marinifilum flexuosum TaxID=1117708 RepID=UPI002494C45F|nr:FecR family protein [Marinifilum flexuosum]